MFFVLFTHKIIVLAGHIHSSMLVHPKSLFDRCPEFRDSRNFLQNASDSNACCMILLDDHIFTFCLTRYQSTVITWRWPIICNTSRECEYEVWNIGILVCYSFHIAHFIFYFCVCQCASSVFALLGLICLRRTHFIALAIGADPTCISTRPFKAFNEIM